jgi:iron complex outermembrane receptor protein
MAKINLLDQSNFLILGMKYFELLLLLSLPLAIQAQQTDTLNEVVVSGTSRPVRIRENPVAITAVSARAIDRTISSNVIDVLVQHTPGLHAVKTGPNISKPFIRGLGYNRVLTLYDGLRQEGQQWGDEHGIEADAYNIHRAEVIKGPASLLYGSDALAGVVSLFPFLPEDKDGRLHGRVLSEYQHNNGLIGNGFRLHASNGRWLWIARGSFRLARNYTNRIDGRIYNTGFSEKNLSFTAGHTFTGGNILVSATLYDNLQGIPDGSRDSLTRKFTRQVEEGAADDLKRRPIVPDGELNAYKLSPLHQHIQHYRLYTSQHYALGLSSLDLSLGFQQNIRREYSHPTAPDKPGLFLRLNTLNYGVRWIAPVFSNLELTAGVGGMLQDNKSREATDHPIPDYRLADLGSYIYGKWRAAGLTLTGGLRYDVRLLRGDTIHRDLNGVSASIGATYALTEQISFKANIARGYRSPNLTELASNGLDPGAHIVYLGRGDFSPEFSFQQDLGVIGYFEGLTVSFSLFNNAIQHYIFLQQLVDDAGRPLTDAQGNKTFQYQQASARLYGGEAALDLHPKNWAGVQWHNSLSMVTGSNALGPLPLIPPFQWLSALSREWQVPRGWFSSFFTRGELEYNRAQNRYLKLYQTETYTPAFSLVNLSLGTNFRCGSPKSLQAQVQVNNLFDVAWQSNLSRLKYFEYYSHSPDGRSGIYGMGRNICLKLIAGF